MSTPRKTRITVELWTGSEFGARFEVFVEKAFVDGGQQHVLQHWVRKVRDPVAFSDLATGVVESEILTALEDA